MVQEVDADGDGREGEVGDEPRLTAKRQTERPAEPEHPDDRERELVPARRRQRRREERSADGGIAEPRNPVLARPGHQQNCEADARDRRSEAREADHFFGPTLTTAVAERPCSETTSR